MENNHRPHTLEQLVDQTNELASMVSALNGLKDQLATSAISPAEHRYRDQRDVYHQITIGAVLMRYDFTAHDARFLDGLLHSAKRKTWSRFLILSKCAAMRSRPWQMRFA